MRRKIFLVLSLVIVAITPLNSDEALVQELINDVNNSAFFNFYLMSKGNNPLFSPFSVHASFLMAYMGAKGETADQIAQGIHLTLPYDKVGPTFSALYDSLYSPKLESSSYEFKIGNAMWVDNRSQILPSYKKTVFDDFHGTVKNVDFSDPVSATAEINAWALKQTAGAIKQFLSPQDITTAARLLLTNGIVLKGPWKYPFKTKETGEKPFLTSLNISKNVPTMHTVGEFPYYEDKDTQYLALPLKSHENQAPLALVIFLPKKVSLSKVFEPYYIRQQEDPKNYLAFIDNLKPKKIDLFLPKFSFNRRIFLKNFFTSIGITNPFSMSADFSGIDGKTDLFISNAFHESFITVDEGGLFAAAASGASFDIKSSLTTAEPQKFIVNHPFFYCILDMKTKLVLFMGIINDPSLSTPEDKTP